LLWIIPISILFGLAAMLFPVPIIGGHYFQSYTISSAIHCRVYASAIYFTGATKYLGLGSLLLSNPFNLVNIMTFTQDFVY
jgi:hypothetical protein